MIFGKFSGIYSERSTPGLPFCCRSADTKRLHCVMRCWVYSGRSTPGLPFCCRSADTKRLHCVLRCWVYSGRSTPGLPFCCRSADTKRVHCVLRCRVLNSYNFLKRALDHLKADGSCGGGWGRDHTQPVLPDEVLSRSLCAAQSGIADKVRLRWCA